MICQPSALPGCRSPFHHPAAQWGCILTLSRAAEEERSFFSWERSFWSPAPSHCLTGGSLGGRIDRRSLSSQPSLGLQEEAGAERYLTSSWCGSQVWKWTVRNWKSVTWFLLAILSLGWKLNSRPQEQGLPSTSSDLCKQKASVFRAGRSECDSKGEMREEGEWRAPHRGDTLEGRASWDLGLFATACAICDWMQAAVRQ